MEIQVRLRLKNAISKDEIPSRNPSADGYQKDQGLIVSRRDKTILNFDSRKRILRLVPYPTGERLKNRRKPTRSII
ncbi:MAG: hypothetical protein IIB00_00330 [candidate division Zixibacteria bacterium]|nr:hypothetical protein [candidate division Zixibacteria bacterium]